MREVEKHESRLKQIRAELSRGEVQDTREKDLEKDISALRADFAKKEAELVTLKQRREGELYFAITDGVFWCHEL